MNLNEFSRLKVLMSKTKSADDSEALDAVRKANAILAACGLSWTQVFDRTVRVEGSGFRPSTAPGGAAGRRAEIENLVAELDGQDRGFVADVVGQYERTGVLSDAQLDALKRIVAERRGPRFSHRR